MGVAISQTVDPSIRPVASSKIAPTSDLQVGSLSVSGDANVGGNIGIGTTIPRSKLHVAGDLIGGNDANGQRFIIQTRTLHPAGNSPGDFLQITGDDTNGVWQWDKGITFVRASGNVGIGTTTPGAKLTVSGITQR